MEQKEKVMKEKIMNFLNNIPTLKGRDVVLTLSGISAITVDGALIWSGLGIPNQEKLVTIDWNALVSKSEP